TALALSGLAPQEIVINRCRSGEPSQNARDLVRAVDGAPVVALPAFDAEPVGVDALTGVGELLCAEDGAGAADAGAVVAADAGADAGGRPRARGADADGASASGHGSGAPGEAVTRESGAGLESVFALELALPLADPS